LKVSHVAFRSLLKGSIIRHIYNLLLQKFNNQSKFRIFPSIGSKNDTETWKDRLCTFSKYICYNRDVSHSYYFQSNQRNIEPLFYDSAKGMFFQFTQNGGRNSFLSLISSGDTPWAPIVVNLTYPTKNFIRLHQLHSLMEIRFGSENIAHGLWEDIGSIYYSMERMDLLDQIPNTVLFRSYQ